MGAFTRHDQALGETVALGSSSPQPSASMGSSGVEGGLGGDEVDAELDKSVCGGLQRLTGAGHECAAVLRESRDEVTVDPLGQFTEGVQLRLGLAQPGKVVAEQGFDDEQLVVGGAPNGRMQGGRCSRPFPAGGERPCRVHVR